MSQKRPKPTTNPLGKGKKNLSTALPEEVRQALKRLAARSGMSLNAFVGAILEDVARRGLVLRQTIQFEAPSEADSALNLTEAKKVGLALVKKAVEEAKSKSPEAPQPTEKVSQLTKSAQKH